MVKPSQYLKTSVGMHFSQILSGNKAAGVNVGEVNDIYTPVLPAFCKVKGSSVSRVKTFIHLGAKKRPLPWE